MKISEMILELQKIQEQHGDLDVSVNDGANYAKVYLDRYSTSQTNGYEYWVDIRK